MPWEKTKNSRPSNWLIHHICALSVKQNVSIVNGRVLDIGCGEKPYGKIIERSCKRYIGLEHPDISGGLKEADVAGNALVLPFKSESFDSVVSFQVMEHLLEPLMFLEEAFRVLRKGGCMLLMTPFMWGEHEQPSDYYRFTRYGLQYLAERAGFEVISIEPQTGYWTMAILRFNYWLDRFAKGPFQYMLMPVWLDQYIAVLLDRLDSSYTVDTATFTTLLRKPT